jgi:hypothetical protein
VQERQNTTLPEFTQTKYTHKSGNDFIVALISQARDHLKRKNTLSMITTVKGQPSVLDGMTTICFSSADPKMWQTFSNLRWHNFIRILYPHVLSIFILQSPLEKFEPVVLISSSDD